MSEQTTKGPVASKPSPKMKTPSAKSTEITELISKNLFNFFIFAEWVNPCKY
jgi:hypothetical protein